MNTTKARIAVKERQSTKEYSLNIDGIIKVPTDLDAKIFFDDLLDNIIDYVESRKALAGLGMSFK